MIKTEIKIESKIYLEMTEGEAMALDAICGYGVKPFKEWFYRNLGKHYLQPYAGSLDTLFEKARFLQSQVQQLNEKKKQINAIINPPSTTK